MREIKFRGFTFNGEWVYGNLYQYRGSFYILSDGYDDKASGFISCGKKTMEILGYYAIVPETAGQFTGLKDKNGKEAYKSDLFKTKSQRVYEIVFEDGAFGYYGPLNGDFVPLKHLIDHNIAWEIISTIHENPALLK